MPLPGGLATVTVTVGPYLTADGTAASGTVTFQPEARAVHIPSGAVVLPGQMTVTLDSAGAGSIALPASDAPGLTPNPLGYWVFWRLNGAPSPDPQRIMLPAAVPAADLDLLLPATTPAGPAGFPGVLSVAGLTGPVVSAGDLGAALGGAAADASPTVKGVLRLAGDLAGTAATPTVPGLAGKVGTSDPRLSDARTPTTHAASHASGGADPITPAAIGADIAGAATTAQSYAVQRGNHTGTQSADTLTDGTTNKAFLAAERTALSGATPSSTASAIVKRDAFGGFNAGYMFIDVDPADDGHATRRGWVNAQLVGKAAASHTHPAADLTATGRTSTNFLRGDNTWATPAAGGGGDPTALTTGEAVASRLFFSSTIGLASQGVRLSYFTAQKTETITQLRTYSGGTAAGATPTLCKIAVYSVAANGDLTQVAVTANDTTLWAATNSAYTRSFVASFTKTAGQMYAVAFLVVTAATAPQVLATPNQFSAGLEQQIAPRLSGFIGTQTDLASSYTAASVQGSSQLPYAAVLP